MTRPEKSSQKYIQARSYPETFAPALVSRSMRLFALPVFYHFVPFSSEDLCDRVKNLVNQRVLIMRILLLCLTLLTLAAPLCAARPMPLKGANNPNSFTSIDVDVLQTRLKSKSRLYFSTCARPMPLPRGILMARCRCRLQEFAATLCQPAKGSGHCRLLPFRQHQPDGKHVVA